MTRLAWEGALELFLIIVGAAVVLWLLYSRSRAGSAVAQSALQNLLDLDSRGAAAWEQLWSALQDTADVPAACRALIAMKGSLLPPKVVELWRYLDDLSERVNTAARHYESLSGRPAPGLSGRGVGERVFARIQARGAEQSNTVQGEVVRRHLPSRPELPSAGASSPDDAARGAQQIEDRVMDGLKAGLMLVAIEQLVKAPECKEDDLRVAAVAHCEKHMGHSNYGRGLIENVLTPDRLQSLAASCADRLRASAARIAAGAVERDLPLDEKAPAPEKWKLCEQLIMAEARSVPGVDENLASISSGLFVLARDHFLPRCRGAGVPPQQWLRDTEATLSLAWTRRSSQNA